MSYLHPKKIDIKKDIPSGRTRSADLPLDIPPPPEPVSVSGASPQSTSGTGDDIALPPLPGALETDPSRPSVQQVDSPPPIPASVPAQENTQHKDAKDPEKKDLGYVEVSPPKDTNPVQLELNRRISQVRGPVFISLERYREVKDLLFTLKVRSHDLRAAVAELKDNKKEGKDLLSKSVECLEDIEESIENINATLRV